MYQNLEMFRVSGLMATHAGYRQAQVARNIANADTPGFHAMAIASFEDTYRPEGPGEMRATRPGHLHAAASGPQARAEPVASEPSPNGNTVSIEEQMIASVNVAREHSRALAIYKHAMTVIRTSLGPSR